MTPNTTGGAVATRTANFTTDYNGSGGACPGGDPFVPTFSASVSNTAAGAHPDLTLQVNRPDKNQQLRNFDVHLPVGLVANTSATPQCSQANAAAGTCVAANAVGTFAAAVGSGAETYSLSGGTIYNVVPNAAEPARLYASLPVVVGPFDLGKLNVPVATALRADFGVDASTVLPQIYEGVPVQIRSLTMVLNGTVGGNSFITNPSKCQVNTISADMISPTPTTVTGTANFTTTGCPQTFNPTIAASVTTTETLKPTGFGLTVNVPANNSSVKRVDVSLPVGMEINPAVGNGPLVACSTATIDAGAAACPATSDQGNVTLNTPLLPNPVTGDIYLETPGTTAATRYKLAIVLRVPGRDLVLHGGALVNGSTTVAAGATGSVDSGTGQVTASFDNIPDLGFTTLAINFTSGNRALLTNPASCGVQTVTADLTPNTTGGATANRTATFTTTSDGGSGACGATPFAPAFTGSVSTTVAGGHPNLTMTATRAEKDQLLRHFNTHLPVGLVANSSAVPQCSQALAAAGNCPVNTTVGSLSATVGTGGETLTLTGTVHNVVPDVTEPARLSITLPVVVGPFDLGKMVMPITTALRSDLGVDTQTQIPSRYEGVAVRVRSAALTLNGVVGGNNFMTNPSKCQVNTVGVDLISPTPTTAARSFNYTTTGCPSSFGTAPTMTATMSSTETAKPAGLTLGVSTNIDNPTIKRVQVTLPSGVEINPAFGNGPLTSCTTANIDAGGAACAASSEVGTVSLVTPLLAGTQTGKVYLETPGTTAATRYKLAIVINLPGQRLIVHGSAQINGSSTISAGATGAVDSGTGRISADFDNIPDLGFTNLTIAFNAGNRAMFVNPSACGTHTVAGTISPNSGGTAATPSASFSTSYNGAGSACPGSDPFAPVFSGSVSTTVAAGHPNLTLGVTRADKQQSLRNFNLHLPSGLVANATAVPQCTQANATAGNCAVGSQVGSLAATIGSGAETLSLSGAIHNVTPGANEPARLQAIVPVVVGPFDLGKLSIPIVTSIRADYGIDASTQLPNRYEGIAVRVRSLSMQIDGVVGGNNFMSNPSKCQVNNVAADMISSTAALATGSFNYTTTGCPQNFVSAPTLSVSVSPSETAKPTGLTLAISSNASNPTIGRVQTALPLGMEINPAVANGPLQACSTAAIDAGAAACPAASVLGTVALTSPLLAAVQSGSIYLETPGTTAATRYRIAVVVNLPGQKLIVHGAATVNGSTDVTGGTGSVDSGTGRIIADFNNIPDLAFSNLTLAFNTGNRALFTNPETCGTHTVNATITPNSGGTDASPSANFSTSYNGAGAACPGGDGFAPTFSGGVSTTQAGGQPDLTLTVTRPDKNQQLREFNLSLPTGLVADTVQTPRCSQANAAAGTCAPATAIGSLTTAIGSGGETNNLSGSIYNTTPDADEPARLTAITDVIVGPFDLGKLSIPVNTTLRGDLGIDTQVTIPLRYEGIPVRVRSITMVLNGVVGGNAFMINPSRCGSNTVSAEMKAPGGATVNESFNYTTTGCPAPFDPTVTAAVDTTETGKPAGLTLDIDVPPSSSSVERVTTVLPLGMEINPAVANYNEVAGSLQACSTAAIDAGGAACPASSVIGTATMDTPLLPTQQSGSVYLESPGATPSTRYRLAIVLHLPGRELIVHGSATVDGSGGGANAGTGQVTADFDELPDLQFANLEIAFKTGKNALLTNPESCGTQTLSADLTPWSDDNDADSEDYTVTRTASFVTSYDGAGAACPGTLPQNPGLTASLSTYQAGANPDVTINLSRPDKDQGIKNVKIMLPNGLVGSAVAAPACAQVDADAGNCATDSLVGSVILDVGSGDDSFRLTGSINNTVAPSNRPAKFTVTAAVVVGPFDLGKVIVPVDVNLNPNDYSLEATTGDMPQRFEGVPVRIRQMQIVLRGIADQGTLATADDVPFMSNPRSCGPAAVRAEITSPAASTVTRRATLPQPITGCETLALDNSIDVANTPTDAQQPTALTVQINQSTAPTQSTLKTFSLALPGFRLNAPAADGLVACTAAQLDAQSCPASSEVGDAWIDTSLLPLDSPGGHSLEGHVYLETPGTAANGSDRYKLAIQLAGKTVITLRGVAVVNETTGDITTTFDNLPDIPFERFHVELQGATNPLLINPETCGSANVSSSMTPWSGAIANETDSLNVTNCTAKGFAPTTTFNLDTYVSGAHPNATFTINRPDNNQDLKGVTMSLPPGFVGSAASVPMCSLANAAAGNCSSASKVGSVQVKLGTAGQALTLPGTVYLTEGVNGEIAGMSVKVPAVAGPYNLGDYVTQGRVVLRPADHGIDVIFSDIPRMFKGVPTQINQLRIDIDGRAGRSPNGTPFLYNASTCGPMTVVAAMTSHGAGNATSTIPYQATDCPVRAFNPSISFTASGGDANNAPDWNIRVALAAGDSVMKSITVLLPSIVTVNVLGLGEVCEQAQAASWSCPVSSRIGTVTIKTPLLPTPVTGTVYVARGSISSLPDLLIMVGAPINLQIRGANKFVNNVNLRSSFDNLPDLLWSELNMNIAGGPKGILGVRANGLCGDASVNYASHSGQSAAGLVKVNGVFACERSSAVCDAPNVAIATKGVKKKGNKKQQTSVAFATAVNCPGIKSFSVQMPKGTKLNKKLLKYKKKDKKLKKNLKNVSGRAGTKALRVTDFAISGRTGLKIKTTLPAGTRSLSFKSIKSSVLLPYKTFCGAIKGTGKKKKKALKKCRAKKVAFTFVLTRDDGSVLRYVHKIKAGDRKLK
ncbi:MAG: hypothetical protein WAP35_08070 [Solirubrobacterales bacterium]